LMCHDECARDVVERGGLPMAQQLQTFPAEPCGCTQAALLDCGDFYEINAACPVHQVGSLVPARCDGRYSQHASLEVASRLLGLNLLTNRGLICALGGADPDKMEDDKCAVAYTNWYTRCVVEPDPSSGAIWRDVNSGMLTQEQWGELESFQEMCSRSLTGAAGH
jgi:hypothetical protein